MSLFKILSQDKISEDVILENPFSNMLPKDDKKKKAKSTGGGGDTKISDMLPKDEPKGDKPTSTTNQTTNDMLPKDEPKDNTTTTNNQTTNDMLPKDEPKSEPKGDEQTGNQTTNDMLPKDEPKGNTPEDDEQGGANDFLPKDEDDTDSGDDDDYEPSEDDGEANDDGSYGGGEDDGEQQNKTDDFEELSKEIHKDLDEDELTLIKVNQFERLEKLIKVIDRTIAYINDNKFYIEDNSIRKSVLNELSNLKHLCIINTERRIINLSVIKVNLIISELLSAYEEIVVIIKENINNGR